MRFVVGLTGASGSILFKKLIDALILQNHEIFIVASDNGKKVFEYELSLNFHDYLSQLDYPNLNICDINDMFSQIASGSFKTDGMIILPCSMGTIGKIAHGTSDNLIIRAADVHIKERRKLLIAFREAPLSILHLNNLKLLAEANVILYPTVISLYNKPLSLDEMLEQMISRILSYFNVSTNVNIEWQGI